MGDVMSEQTDREMSEIDDDLERGEITDQEHRMYQREILRDEQVEREYREAEEDRRG